MRSRGYLRMDFSSRNWWEKAKEENPPLGPNPPQVWANARTCLVHAVLGGFVLCKTRHLIKDIAASLTNS